MERTMSDTTSNDRHKAAMKERNSMNLNNNGGKGGKPQVKKENVTTTTNKPGKHPYDRK
jgi:hypothetical protein